MRFSYRQPSQENEVDELSFKAMTKLPKTYAMVLMGDFNVSGISGKNTITNKILICRGGQLSVPGSSGQLWDDLSYPD